MKNPVQFLSLFLFLFLPSITFAIPAHPGFRTIVNPDGTAITLRLLGDEFGHVTVDESGIPYREAPDGFWRPAAPEEKERLSTHRSPRLQRRSPTKATAFPRTGQARSLVVLVDFPDVEFSTAEIKREIDEMLNLPGFDRREHIGSAADYFRVQSQGQFDPSFDLYGPVRASRPATYYGENDDNGDDMRARDLAIEICRKLDDTVDFSLYDLDGDGMIDNLYFFYAGYGENFAGNKAAWIWPHADHLDNYDIDPLERTFDGKILNSYGCCPELYGSTGTDITAIGTFCHEFSHILGLPDTYDANYALDGSSDHPDRWDIMASGSYLPATRNCGAVPAGYTAVERWLLGWAEPVEIAAPQKVELPPLQSSGRSARISTSHPDEFFILENRQLTGYDRFIPSHGLLVWHVDRRAGATVSVTLNGQSATTISCADAWDLNFNAVNCNATHQCLEIEKASGNGGSKSSLDTPFPGRQMRTSFTDDTEPSMRSWNGEAQGKPVTAIAERNGIISFDFMGGTDNPVAVTALEPADVTATGFTARWNPVAEAADGYTATLFGVERSTLEGAFTIDAELTAMPEWWSAEGDVSFDGFGATIGGSKASSITTAAVDLSRGGTLTVRASQTAASAATLKVYAGQQLIDQYIPTATLSDYVIAVGPTDATTITLAVDRRKSVTIGHVGLQQDLEQVSLTPLARERETATSHRFDGLESGREYAFRVSVNGYASGDSPEVFVTLSENPSAIDVVSNEAQDTDSVPIYYNLQGIRVANPAAGHIYIIKQGNRTYKLKK